MIANFESKIFLFILVPFYTHVDILIATVSLFSPIATLGIGIVIIMFLAKKEYEEKKIFINTTALSVLSNV